MKPNPQLDQFWHEYPEYNGLEKEYAAFGVSFVPLAFTDANVRAAFRAPPDADLVLTSAFTEVLTAGSLAYSIAVPILLTFVNNAEARNVNNVPLDITCMSGFGNAAGPLASTPWPWPIVIKANTVFSVIATNLDPGNGFNVFITFAGVRVLLPAGLVAHG